MDFLKNERFFKDEEIVDKAIDLPKVHLPKKAPTNNFDALKKAHKNVPAYIGG